MIHLLNEIHYERPGFIIWSPAVVLAVFALGYIAHRIRCAVRSSYASDALLSRTTRLPRPIHHWLTTIAWQVAAFFACVAMSGPFLPNKPVTLPEGSLHVVAAFDVSLSMACEDYRFVLPTPDGAPPLGPWGSRLQMAKRTFVDQVFKAIPGNKVALVTYTGDGYPQAPLCQDYSTLKYIMTDTGWMGINSAPGTGSDFVEGLKCALQTLRRDFDPAKRQVVMLFSDGGMPDFKSPDEKAQWQADLDKTVLELDALRQQCGGNLTVVVVGVGDTQPQMVPVYDPRTFQRVDWHPFGKPEKSQTALDEDVLKDLAAKTQGTYVWLSTDTDTDQSRKVPVDWINAIGGTKQSEGKLFIDRYPLAATMLLVAVLLSRGLFRRHDDVRKAGPKATFLKEQNSSH